MDCWSIFEVFGVRVWSKNAPGTRTIIFPVSIPHIVHSRPISSQFWHFRPSPILCISARQRLFFFCNKKIQSKSFISPLWRISFALGHEKSVQSYPNRSHRHSESSNVFEKCHMGPWAQWARAHGPLDPALLNFFSNFFSEIKREIPWEFPIWWRVKCPEHKILALHTLDFQI